jgi:Superinfection immunity protein
MFSVFILLFIAVGYFLPALIAGHRGHLDRTAISWLNILLGWTFLGWLIAFIWSLTGNTERNMQRMGMVLARANASSEARPVFDAVSGARLVSDERYLEYLPSHKPPTASH